MDTGDRAERAWGRDGSGMKGVNGGKKGRSVILAAIKIIFKNTEEEMSCEECGWWSKFVFLAEQH